MLKTFNYEYVHRDHCPPLIWRALLKELHIPEEDAPVIVTLIEGSETAQKFTANIRAYKELCRAVEV